MHQSKRSKAVRELRPFQGDKRTYKNDDKLHGSSNLWKGNEFTNKNIYKLNASSDIWKKKECMIKELAKILAHPRVIPLTLTHHLFRRPPLKIRHNQSTSVWCGKNLRTGSPDVWHLSISVYCERICVLTARVFRCLLVPNADNTRFLYAQICVTILCLLTGKP